MSIGIKLFLANEPNAPLAQRGSCNCCGRDITGHGFLLDYAPAGYTYRNPNMVRVCDECIDGLGELVERARNGRLQHGQRTDTFHTPDESRRERGLR